MTIPEKQPSVDGQCVEYFNSQADAWSDNYLGKKTFRDRLALFTDALRRLCPAPARILDYGCGAGFMSLAIAGMGYEVVGVDLAQKMVQRAQEEAARLNVYRATFSVLGQRPELMAQESFDAVVCSSVLEYLYDDMDVLASLANVLRPGGVLLVSVPHSASLLGRLQSMSRYLIRASGLRGQKFLEYVKRRYDIELLQRQMRQMRLEPLERIYFESPLPGPLSTPLSRWKRIGIMCLVNARKIGPNTGSQGNAS